MFRTRLITATIVIPLVLLIIAEGGLWFFALILALLTLGVFEFWQMMRQCEYQPTLIFAIALAWVLIIDAQFPQLGIQGIGVSLVLLSSLAWQLAHREGSPAADWALTLVGALYLGWCGAHFIRLRNLPEGLWWMLTTLPAIWLADSGAYSIGRAWGKHKLAPGISPGKTWEGWAGGVVVGTVGAMGLAAVWNLSSGPSGPTALKGLALGLIVSLFAPIGDLVISMFKRQAAVKDSGKLFPGHGGALDRVDSLLWAAVIGYYFALWFS